MAKFANSKTQAASVAREFQREIVKSNGSVRNYKQELKSASDYMKENGYGTLRDMDIKLAEQYLQELACDFSQSKVNLAKQSLQLMMQKVTGKLALNSKLNHFLVEKPTKLLGRAYKNYQVEMVQDKQTSKYDISTQICHATGIRAHELLTIRPASEQIADIRPLHNQKFVGRSGVIYTVVGKGGLTRSVMMPKELALKLEALRLNKPRQVIDRNIKYTQHYNIGGGKNFSASFSKASQRALGWSTGAHGLRHAYAQERMREIQSLGLPHREALLIVSQELGHFRPDITKVYLR